MNAKLLGQNIAWMAFMAAMLFLPAGTMSWPGGWAFLIEMGAGGLILCVWLARYNPALLAERMSPPIQKTQKRSDKLVLGCLLVLYCGWMMFMGVDAGRFHAFDMPVWLQSIGAAAVAFSLYMGYLTFRENSFAAPVVKIQSERGHSVISTGPYRYVRHPMYAGALVGLVGTPLLLGSRYGLAVVPVLAVILAVRVVLEERTLKAELPGYGDYTASVRYRLIPLIW